MPPACEHAASPRQGRRLLSQGTRRAESASIGPMVRMGLLFALQVFSAVYSRGAHHPLPNAPEQRIRSDGPFNATQISREKTKSVRGVQQHVTCAPMPAQSVALTLGRAIVHPRPSRHLGRTVPQQSPPPASVAPCPFWALSDNGRRFLPRICQPPTFTADTAYSGPTWRLRIPQAPLSAEGDVVREIGNLDEAAKLVRSSRARFPDDLWHYSAHAGLLEGNRIVLSAFISLMTSNPKLFPAPLVRDGKSKNFCAGIKQRSRRHSKRTVRCLPASPIFVGCRN